ncbi:MAG: peptidoglycan-binding protein [Solirubrobacterales bacterium]|nr:peptidoglycan-binding protein [Solirubrobacterales bacterium]
MPIWSLGPQPSPDLDESCGRSDSLLAVFKNLMTKTHFRRFGLLALALPVLFMAIQSAAQPAQAGIYNRAGMWIWYVDDSNGGNLGSIIREAKRARVGTVYIKSGDGDDAWSQFNRRLVNRLHRAGLKVCGWQYVYGDKPVAEARISAVAKRRGADCFVIDAEAEYEQSKYAAADMYIRELRRLVGPRFPLALSTFPYAHYHPSFPYSVFLGPGAATANLPQVYWHAIGDSVRTTVEITWEQNTIYKRRIWPVGQTYENPPISEILAFRRFMLNYGSAPSWWSWQETNSTEWRALGKTVPRVGGYRPYTGKPTVERGMKGDQVVWLQQHLIGAGYNLEPTGIFSASTYRAVRKFQQSRGLEVDGVVGTTTWNRLLRVTPVRVRWSAARNRALRAGVSSAGGVKPGNPLSANLPAVRNELAGVSK